VTFAKILLKLWTKKIWVAIGGIVAVVAAVGSMSMSHSTVYASASTQMLVDSPQSALANAGVDLSGYLARANVFARLMTSAEALQYVGHAAGIPGSVIQATGPVEVNGSPVATHIPTSATGGPAPANAPAYKLNFVQNPDLPTVDVYAEAPTTQKAIALANGAVTGFSAFISHVEDGAAVPAGKRIVIRELGAPVGGMVDAAASKKIAAMVFVLVLVLWCGVVLYVSRLRAQIRAAKAAGDDDEFTDVATSPADEDYFLPVPQHEPAFSHPADRGRGRREFDDDLDRPMYPPQEDLGQSETLGLGGIDEALARMRSYDTKSRADEDDVRGELGLRR
jgi:hypothetical protein